MLEFADEYGEDKATNGGLIMRKLLALTLSTGLLAGCEIPFPKACKYDTSIVSGTVTEVAEWHIMVENEVETFRVDYYDLDRDMTVGESVTFERSLITQGTCVPIYYTEVTPDAASG
jgi:hypothetical protein